MTGRRERILERARASRPERFGDGKPELRALAGEVRISGVEIDRDLLARQGVHLEERIHKCRIQLGLIGRHLPLAVVSGRLRSSRLQPVQRTRARQSVLPVAGPGPLRTGEVRTSARQRQHAVASNQVMVGEILVGRHKTEDALPDQSVQGVSGPDRVPVVGETGSNPSARIHDPVGFPQEKRSPVGRHPPAVESTGDLTSAHPLKRNLPLRTECLPGQSIRVKGKYMKHIPLTHSVDLPSARLVTDP